MAEQSTSHKRKADIYNAAEQVFSRAGFDAARIDDIAQQAGVAKGTIYLYFPSKQELFISLIETRLEEIIVMLAKELDSVTNPEEVIRILVMSHLRFYVNHDGMVNLLFQTMGQFMEEAQPRMLEIKKRIKKYSNQALQQVLPSDYPIKPETLEMMVSGSITVLIAEYIETDTKLVPEEIVDSFVHVFLPGISKYQIS